MAQKNKLAHILLQLSLIEDVGSVTIANLIENIGTDLQNLYQYKLADLQRLGFSQAKASLILAGLCDSRELDLELAFVDKYQVKWSSILDQDYPELLRHIQGAPAILYWRGDLPGCLARTLAMVGSRKANSYAKNVIDEIVPSLVQAGYTIVSGGALGVDSMAHRAALLAGGKTVVVVGTGLMHNYPAQHIKLYEQVVQAGGAIVSCFKMNMAGLPGNFPARNRIISGLSEGCLVVQAASQSGAKITAQFALEQGRDLFVVPGLFGDELSAGCHELAQQGAKVIHQVQDIFSDLQPGRKIITYKPAVLKNNSSDINSIIINLCNSPVSLTALLDQLDLQVGDLQERLFDLQLKGLLRQNFAGLWEKG